MELLSPFRRVGRAVRRIADRLCVLIDQILSLNPLIFIELKQSIFAVNIFFHLPLSLMLIVTQRHCFLHLSQHWLMQARFLLLLLSFSISFTAAARLKEFAGANAPSSLVTVRPPNGAPRSGSSGPSGANRFVERGAVVDSPAFQPAGAGDERWLNDFSLPSRPNGKVTTVVQVGQDIYIGGEFTMVGTVAANRIARWDGTVWHSLGTGAGNGVNNFVSDLAAGPNGELYVGGGFTAAGGVPAHKVARWNGTTWSSIGTTSTIVDVVGDMAVGNNGELYVGGFFSLSGGRAPGYVARWNGMTWSQLGRGTDLPIQALAVAPNGDVYVGGYFEQCYNSFSTTPSSAVVEARNVARWNGTQWHSLGTGVANGVNSDVDALTVTASGEVYAGGRFNMAGSRPANCIARWNGTAWSSLGTGTANGVNNFVTSVITTNNGDVYAGGIFTEAGGALANRVARWNGSAWTSLGAGTTNGMNDVVLGLFASSDGDVYAAGSFTRAGRAAAHMVARWQGTAWNPLRTGIANGINGTVYALAVASNGDVYAGGVFTQAGGVAVRNIARWNGTSWSALRLGESDGVNGPVYALATGPNGTVFAGGGFTEAGGETTYGVARWDGAAWTSLGTGASNGVNSGDVTALAVAGNGDLYVGGRFIRAGSVSVNHVARWNGTSWSALGTGMNGAVLSLAVASNGDVYAGGDFVQSSSVVGNRVARWNGTAWTALGTGIANGVNGSVKALAIGANGEVFVGGQFTLAGGAAARNAARWNGTAWTPLAMGLNSNVQALTVARNGDLYASGFFQQAGGGAANRIARWDGTTWTALGTGLNASVWSIAIGLVGEIYAGGSFTAVGDGSKATVGFGVYDTQLVLATAGLARSQAPTFYPNPARNTITLTLPANHPRVVLFFDMVGREVRRQLLPVGSTTATLDLTGLTAGTYILQVGSGKRRLVIE